MEKLQKKLGQYFTDPAIADFMASLVIHANGKSFLDPALGQGVFSKSLEPLLSHPVAFTAYEIDPDLAAAAQTNWPQLQLHRQDYLQSSDESRYDMILCNPPYRKFKGIPHREQLVASFEARYGVRLSPHCNLYVYFLIKALGQLSTGGRCAFILPFDFLNADYGIAVKEYLLKTGMLESVIRFDDRMKLFPEALTTSCILVFQNSPHASVDFISVTDLAQLKTRSFPRCDPIAYADCLPERKWSDFFRSGDPLACKNLVPFSALAKVHRGLATGNNDFFLLSREQILLHGLSLSACRPCLTHAKDVLSPVFTREDFQKLSQDGKRAWLFDGSAAATPADRNYILLGQQQKIHEGYLCSHRPVWYAPENRAPAPIWISTFRREQLRIVRNEAGIHQLTAFHGIYPHDMALCEILFCYLLTDTAQALLLQSSRDCGGGLKKLEPRDVSRSFVLDLRRIHPADRERILRVRAQIPTTPPEVYLPALEDIFRPYLTH